MGKRKITTQNKLSERSILQILNRNYLSNPKYVINNLHIFLWESDYLSFTNSGYSYEVEVKISKADFKRDFKKHEKHIYLQTNQNKLGKINIKPNYFSYCAPKGVLNINDIPEYAGFYEITEFNSIDCVKFPPKLHNDKIEQILNLKDAFYYNYKHLLKIKDSLIKKIDLLEKQINNHY